MHAVALGALIALVLNATYIQVTDPPEREFEEYLAARTGYPVAAAQFVRDSLPRRTGRLINDFDWGGYLIYALWPEYQVMLDGRTQVYPERLWRAAYVDATRESLRGLFRAAEADAALLPRGAGWGEILEADLGWEVVYSDSLAAVWRPPGSGRPPR